jgi:hypothetical protein
VDRPAPIVDAGLHRLAQAWAEVETPRPGRAILG